MEREERIKYIHISGCLLFEVFPPRHYHQKVFNQHVSLRNVFFLFKVTHCSLKGSYSTFLLFVPKKVIFQFQPSLQHLELNSKCLAAVPLRNIPIACEMSNMLCSFAQVKTLVTRKEKFVETNFECCFHKASFERLKAFKKPLGWKVYIDLDKKTDTQIERLIEKQTD